MQALGTWRLRCESGAFPTVPASVPGNVQSDLENARALLPFHYGLGDAAIWEVARNDFLYETELTLPEAPRPDARRFLQFDGVDFACTVAIDGVERATHAGMFERFSVEISELAPGTHALTVRIAHMPPELEPWIRGSDGAFSGENTPYFFVDAMNQTRRTLGGFKSITNFSYDWGTNLWTMGIWRPVAVLETGSVRVLDLRVESAPQPDGSAVLTCSATLDAAREARVCLRGDVRAIDGAESLPFAHSATVRAGVQTLCWEITIPQAKLWYPAGYGAQPLYILQLEALADDIHSDTRAQGFGIRNAQWGQMPGFAEDFPNPLRLLINGQTVRTLGSTANATDLLHGRAHAKGRALVERAREFGIRLLRMHGGQVIFTDDFYDACDELGILLSIDFPVGNCVVEDDPALLAAWEPMTRDIVRQLRNHPSIVEWCGGNEMGWQHEHDFPALELARRVVREEDTRIFRATCPDAGVRHAPWDYNPWFHYKQYNDPGMRDQTARYPMGRHGEFGTQSPANLEIYKRTIPPASRFPIRLEDPVLIRKNAVQAVFCRDAWLMPGIAKTLFGKAQTLEDLFTASYWLSFEGLRYAFDSLRWRETLGGCTSWCFNEPWPNGAGTHMIDYDGRPLPMAYGARQALLPITLSLRYDSVFFDLFDGLRAQVMLTSDAPAPETGLRWRCVLRDHRGGVYGESVGMADIAPLETYTLTEIEIAPPVPLRAGPVFAELTLSNAAGTVLAERLYIFAPLGVRDALRGLLSDEYPDPDLGAPYSYTGVHGAPVKRTQLRAAIVAQQCARPGCGESITLRVWNEGENTAAFCHVEPTLEYRPELRIAGQFGFVPPGEAREFCVEVPEGCGVYVGDGDGDENREGCGDDKRGARSDRAVLSLAQLGWEVHSLNADTAYVAPRGVWLAMGRKDGTCEGYAGTEGAVCADAVCEHVQYEAENGEQADRAGDACAEEDCAEKDLEYAAIDGRIIPEAMPWMLGQGEGECSVCALRVRFSVGRVDAMDDMKSAEGTDSGASTDSTDFAGSTDPTESASFEKPTTACRLLLHTADRAYAGARLCVALNGCEQEVTLPGGYGIQQKTPLHYASPHSLALYFPASALRDGENTLSIRSTEGWFTWDALSLSAIADSKTEGVNG